MYRLLKFCLRNIDEGSNLYYGWVGLLLLLMYLGIEPSVEQALRPLAPVRKRRDGEWVSMELQRP